MPELVDQIGGAVHGVQNPEGAAGVNGGLFSLLPQKLHSRGQLFQLTPEGILHGEIHIGDEVRPAFGYHGLDGGGNGQQSAGLTDGLHHLPGQGVGENTHAMASLVRMET